MARQSEVLYKETLTHLASCQALNTIRLQAITRRKSRLGHTACMPAGNFIITVDTKSKRQPGVPGAQLQTRPELPMLQVAPFRHGLLSQLSSVYSSQPAPVDPESKQWTHLLNLCLLTIASTSVDRESKQCIQLFSLCLLTIISTSVDPESKQWIHLLSLCLLTIISTSVESESKQRIQLFSL